MIKDAIVESLLQHYNGEVPEYILSAGKSFLTFQVDDWDGTRGLKVTISDVVEYYYTQAPKLSSGIRHLADVAGDWRYIDNLAKEALEWFKFINRPALVREGKKRGMTLRT